MDREGANFDKVLSEIQSELSAKATPLYIPIGKESNFQGVVDILAMKACISKLMENHLRKTPYQPTYKIKPKKFMTSWSRILLKPMMSY